MRGDAPARELTKALGGRWYATYGVARCPAHDDRSPSLSIAEGRDGRLLLRCSAGCPFGDIRDALIARGLMAATPERSGRREPREVARREAAKERERARREARARWIWQEARPARGTLGKVYFRRRHLDLPEAAPLQFHPAAPHPSGARLPATVALIEAGEGFAVHCTYLDERGRKAAATPAKAIFGLPRGGTVRLIAAPPSGSLLIAEGTETALAAATLWGGPCGAWATCSAFGMEVARIPDPEADDAPGEIVALGDGDGAGRRAMERLAERAARAGFTTRTLLAPDGMDWADVLAVAMRREVAA